MPEGCLHLRLYVAADAPQSVRARENLRAALELLPEGAAELEVIDVFEHPARALEDRVVVTPLLLRVSPGPRAGLFGSLTDADALRALLRLESADRDQERAG